MSKSPTMTREEFIAYYARNSGMTPEQYSKMFTALRCYCGSDSCRGWATILQDQICIDQHMRGDGAPR